MSEFMLINPDLYKLIRLEQEHSNKWEKLFTSYGLNILFPKLGINAKQKIHSLHALAGKLY
jgi:hypothetical protein